MQDAVVDMDRMSLIITSLDVKGAFPNTQHRLLRAVWEHMGLPFQGFLQAYLLTRLRARKPIVGTTPWVHPASGVPQGGAEGPFLFLLVTLPLGFTSDAHTRMWHHILYGPRSWRLRTTWRW